MADSPDQIRSEVERARERVRQDLNSLEYRVKTMADWRWHFRRHPWRYLGAVFGAAMLAGLAVTRKPEPTGIRERVAAWRERWAG